MKVLLFGLDCAIGERWAAYAAAGELPVAKRLLEDGAHAPNCLSPLPTLTTTNWTTLATGAWPGTHGITDFNMHQPGDPLDHTPQAFDSSNCQAEYIWNAAARAGKRTVLVNYPSSWPPALDHGVQVGGAGCEVTDWRIGLPAEDRKVSLAAEQLFSTEGEPLCTPVSWNPESDELVLELGYADSLWPIEERIVLLARVDQVQGQPRLRVGVAGDSPTATLGRGDWSQTLACEVTAGGRRRRAVFRVKLLDLDPARRLLRLFVTDLCSVDGLEHPDGALGDVALIDGLPLASVGFDALTLGWIDLETMLELHEINITWLEQASLRLLSAEDWDIFSIHLHAVDWFYHLASAHLSDTVELDPGKRTAYDAAELRIYQAMDAAIGSILSSVSDPRLAVVVSDHGATALAEHVPTQQILQRAGLLVLTEDVSLEAERGYMQPLTVDWGKTLAVPQRSCWVYVNLQGRDPDGIVPPDQYAAVQDRIIDALLAYRDPATGLCPYSLVLRKQDARILGLHGDRIGDVVFAVREEFSDEHGQILGTASPPGFSSMPCTLVMSGPGVKQGVSIDRTVWLTDVVPTICHIARLPMPRDTEGAVIYQMLERPDGLLEDYDDAVDRLERLTNTIRRRQALTHQPYG